MPRTWRRIRCRRGGTLCVSLLSTKEAAKRLGCSPQTVRRLTRELGLPAVRYNRNFKYDERQLDAWIAEHRYVAFFEVSSSPQSRSAARSQS